MAEKKEKKPEVVKKNKNILGFFIKMIFTFILVEMLIVVLPSIFTQTSIMYKYGTDLLAEIFYAFLILIVMLLFKNSYVFTQKKMDFARSLSYGLPILFFSGIILFSNVTNLDGLVIGNFINVLLLCTFVGIAEEFMCRGWIQNEFIERFGDNKKNIILSIVFSSLIFGLMHITNAFGGQDLFSTILQIVQATAFGVLLGSIYYKTKNIWAVVFIHAFFDFAIFMGDVNLIKDCTTLAPTLGTTIAAWISTFLISLFYILSAVLVFKQTNLKERGKKAKNLVPTVVAIVVVFMAMFVPFEEWIDGYENNEECYTYEELKIEPNTLTHYPMFDKYTIEHDIKDVNLSLDENDVSEQITVNQFKYELSSTEDNKLIMTNLITGYSVELGFTNSYYNYEVVENGNKYYIVVNETNGIESTIYYSSFITKENMSNENAYLDGLKKSFREYPVPLIQDMGYITLQDGNNYPFFISDVYDKFIIVDDKLYNAIR